VTPAAARVVREIFQSLSDQIFWLHVGLVLVGVVLVLHAVEHLREAGAWPFRRRR
jgi:hypothetical protein